MPSCVVQESLGTLQRVSAAGVRAVGRLHGFSLTPTLDLSSTAVIEVHALGRGEWCSWRWDCGGCSGAGRRRDRSRGVAARSNKPNLNVIYPAAFVVQRFTHPCLQDTGCMFTSSITVTAVRKILTWTDTLRSTERLRSQRSNQQPLPEKV